jgi:hypothetical protein
LRTIGIDVNIVADVSIVALDRRFASWDDRKPSATEIFAFTEALGGLLDWAELLKSRRVVILAEAGSGKSTELKERARLMSAEGRFAFYATVQEVGGSGLAKALNAARRPERRSTTAEPAPSTGLRRTASSFPRVEPS